MTEDQSMTVHVSHCDHELMGISRLAPRGLTREVATSHDLSLDDHTRPKRTETRLQRSTHCSFISEANTVD